MNAIKLTCTDHESGTFKVLVAFGVRAEKSPSYTFHPVGTLDFDHPEHWAMFRDALSRGVKRPSAVFIEEGAE